MDGDLIIRWRRMLTEMLQAKVITITQGIEVMKELERMDKMECEMTIPEVLRKAA